MNRIRPAVRPARPFFSSGPCAKHPGWAPDDLRNAILGRSHRSKVGMARIREVLERTSALLELPPGYRVALVPASDTGAMELAMWSLLGPRPVDVLVWENFGAEWMIDTVEQLKLQDARVFKAPFGQMSDFAKTDSAHDIVFVWNGTTSGVRLPDSDWIAADREGLTICDATSAAFAMDMPWDKLDVTTFSWQKSLGGEAAHGMLVLSPRAVARFESYSPPWPLPKIFRLTKNGKLHEGFFEGETLNTPSMLALEDYLDTLRWAESIGGLKVLFSRTDGNYAALARWVRESDWLVFMAEDERIRSNTSVCLTIIDAWFTELPNEEKMPTVKRFAALLEKEGIAFDIASHRSAPPGLRIWCGPTVDAEDVEALTPWLDWGWAEIKSGS